MERPDGIWVEIVAVTDRALLVTDGNRECWLPKSKVDSDRPAIDDLKKGDEVELFVPQWLAEKEGLV